MAIKGQCRSFPSLLLLLSLWWEESIFIRLVMIIRVFFHSRYSSSSSSSSPLLLFPCHSEDHKAGDDYDGGDSDMENYEKEWDL